MTDQEVERLSGAGERPTALRGRKRFWEVFAVAALLAVLAGTGAALYSIYQRQARLDRDLVMALSNWEVDAMEQLVRQGASAKKISASGVSCAVLAATLPTPDLLREVLDRGAPASPVRGPMPNPLLLAAQAGRDTHIRLLLERGVQVDATDADGKTALMYATAATGTPEVLRTLLDAGAKIDQVDHKGQTALMWAIAWNDPHYVELLRDAGADLTLRDRNGRTALDRARLKEKEARRNQATRPQTSGSYARMRRSIAALESLRPVPKTPRGEAASR